MKLSQSGFMFGCPFQISYFDNFSNSLILLERCFILTFTMAYLAVLYFVNLALIFRARAVTNHFPDPSIFIFDSEDVVSILSRFSNSSYIFKILFMFKLIHSSLSLNYLCFLTLRWPQFLMFTDSNKSCFLPVNVSSQNVFRVEQPW